VERRRLQTGGSDYERGGRTPDRGRCGITAMSHGEDILLKAAAEQPHKIATLALLKPGPGEWRAQDWVAYFDARKQSTARRNGRSRTQAASLGGLRAALTLQGWGARRVAGHPCHRQKIGVTGGAIPLSGGAGKRRRTRGVDRVPRSWCP
jgi:hypothetical protein